MTGDPGDRPRILLSDRQRMPADAGALIALAARTLRAEGRGDVELSVSLVAREEIAELHERYLGEPGPTDVLSFPQDEETLDGSPAMLGDVVICPEVAAEQEGGESEVRLLLVHGILHLLGYDHEREEDRAEMWERQERYSGIRLEDSA